MGDDRYRIKVSADGGTWKDSMSVDPASGRVFFPNGATDLLACAPMTTGTPAAFVLTTPMGGPMPDGCIFWMVPHVPNATALNVDPTLLVSGIDAAPLPLKNFDGGALAQGSLEANRAVLVRKVGSIYCAQTRRTGYSFFNLLDDGGRFAGNPETQTNVAAAYADSTSFGSVNGSARTVFGQARSNSSTFGGAAGALQTQVAELVSKIRSGSSLLNGAEFWVNQTTAGIGTASGVTVQGTSYYTAFGATRMTGKGFTSSLYFRVVSGSLVIAPADVCPRVLIDGVTHDVTSDTPDRVFTAAQGWKHMQRWIASPDGFTAAGWPLRATPGTVILTALPAVMPGLETLPWDIGPVPSLRGWR
ncbi:MAG: hypothetical protein JWL62_874 [Hyphomicrobiales bacterium]|nr:hypothetical protein [Hyphomicrobiales bacterium]